MGTSSVKRTCSINDKCNLPLSPKFQFNENEIRLKFFTKISLKWRCKSSKIMKSHEFVIPMNLWKLSKKQVLVSSKSNHSKMIIGTQFNINGFNILNDQSIAPSKQTPADNDVRVLSLPRFVRIFRKILSDVCLLSGFCPDFLSDVCLSGIFLSRFCPLSGFRSDWRKKAVRCLSDWLDKD